MQPLSSNPSASSPSSPTQETSQTSVPNKTNTQHSTAPQQSDVLDLSKTGQDMQHYTETMADLPDIRQERIAEIQGALRSGSYSVSAEDLADSLIQDLSTQLPSSSQSSS